MALGFPHLTSLDIPPLAAGDTELCQEGEGFQGSGGKRPLGGGGTFWHGFSMCFLDDFVAHPQQDWNINIYIYIIIYNHQIRRDLPSFFWGCFTSYTTVLLAYTLFIVGFFPHSCGLQIQIFPPIDHILCFHFNSSLLGQPICGSILVRSTEGQSQHAKKLA